MAKKYRESPIAEAVCEIRFSPDPAWNIGVPGQVAEEIRDEFPVRRPVVALQSRLAQGPDGISQEVSRLDLLRCLSSQESAFVQVGQNLLSVHQLRPYEGWNVFQPQVRRGLETYCRVSPPKGVERIGLRYVNVIELPGPTVRLEDYFEFYPFSGPSLPDLLASFLARGEYQYEAGRDLLRVQLSPRPASGPDRLAFTLDIDYFLARQGELRVDSAVGWLEGAHRELELFFEGCIKDSLRQIFGEDAE